MIGMRLVQDWKHLMQIEEIDKSNIFSLNGIYFLINSWPNSVYYIYIWIPDAKGRKFLPPRTLENLQKTVSFKQLGARVLDRSRPFQAFKKLSGGPLKHCIHSQAIQTSRIARTRSRFAPSISKSVSLIHTLST